jgi:hypothetical protein
MLNTHMPERLENVTVTWRFLLGAHELIHVSICKRKKTAIIMLKILGTTIQNLAAFATKHLGFVYPRCTVLINRLINA